MKTDLPFLSVGAHVRSALAIIIVAGLTATASGASSVSPSELLEQGIYSEETKGDLDAAMQLYEQVVKEASSARTLAAQAQYRLGVCYYKKKDFARAAAAFEELTQKYADEKQIVALAAEYLANATPLLPAPWADGEEVMLALRTSTGVKLGTAHYTVVSADVDGRKAWRVGSRFTAAGVRQVSRVLVEAGSFKPIESRWRHSVLGDATTTYSGPEARLQLEGKPDVQTVQLGGVCYDNEEVIHLMRLLPLSLNYTTTLRVFTGLGGGQIIPFKLEVVGKETVETPMGSFECFKVQLSLVNQTFWCSADAHRYLVKFEAGGLVAELAEVTRRNPAEWASSAEAEFNFPLGAPVPTPTVEPAEQQSTLNQAKLLMLTAMAMPTIPAGENWCEQMNAAGAKFPETTANTVFALNKGVAGKALPNLPIDTVVFFETAAKGANRSGGPELLPTNAQPAAVAFADGSARLVDPAEFQTLRWTP